MIWQNIWALAGLVAVGLPIVAHLLSRDRARVQPFPSLRFLDAARLPPTRRTRLTDIALLAVRGALVAVAVFALAQPLLLTARRRRVLDADVTRAIVVDTSASMHRVTPGGERTLDAARREAARYLREAPASIVIETNAPYRAIPGAAAWLASAPGKRELIVLSDFQVGTLDTADLGIVPADAGIHLARIEATAATGAIDASLEPSASIVARITPAADAMHVEWRVGKVARDTAFPVVVLSGEQSRTRVRAAERAVLTVHDARPTHAATMVVFPDYEQRAALRNGATPLDAAWMDQVVTRVRADSVLALASLDAAVVDDAPPPASSVVLARNAAGRAVAYAARIAPAAGDTVTRVGIFATVEPGTFASVALLDAAMRAQSPADDATELDPAFVPSASLERWERIASRRAGRSDARDGVPSDGRWLWLGVLALLAVEWLMRRRAPSEAAVEVLT